MLELVSKRKYLISVKYLNMLVFEKYFAAMILYHLILIVALEDLFDLNNFVCMKIILEY